MLENSSKFKKSLKVEINPTNLAKGAEGVGHLVKAGLHFKAFFDKDDKKEATIEAVQSGLAVASAIATVAPAHIGVAMSAFTGLVSIFVGGGEEEHHTSNETGVL